MLATYSSVTRADENRRYAERQQLTISSWVVHIDKEIVNADPELAKRAMESLEQCLDDITKVVPTEAIKKLKAVPLYISQPYPGTAPKAEYHPSGDWLRENGRDPKMAKAVEFTNLEIFEDELIRMPWFVLHELAHAYHDQQLPDGFGNSEIKANFHRVKSDGLYDTVERKLGRNRNNVFEPAYGLTNPMEFFAEASESYFGINDFAPFNRKELEALDPKTAEMIRRAWSVREEDHLTPK